MKLLFITTIFAKTFITAPCQSDNDCTSDCCGFRSGKCAGPIIALERDSGCGFGSATPNANAARRMGFQGAFPPVQVTPAPPATQTPTPKTPRKKTFITDVCQSDEDCESGCCGFNTGKCAGPVIAQQRDGGCKDANGVRNGRAARRLGFTGPLAPGAVEN